ncbi:TRAP transporter small permease subunit [Halopseudomonas salegens]|uniref:TRAP transporter small permease protein n=1 Tax=Halopseudomonas salegens TaxID=1434072 RepID=A0A1H2HR33_9GAMM|nr:TRAP transporter small permease subunit [Halopseudomonas salegens]SDU34363.1 TRAP-type mannitol/chloroaromatic compound transport system, small permease component [Halopseudomonas salegens]
MPDTLLQLGLPLANAIDRLNRTLGRALAWLSVLLVLFTVTVVVLRYGFERGNTALQELTLYAHGLMFLGAAAWALQRDSHVRVDVFYRRFSRQRQALIDLIGTLFLLLPMCLFLAWNCWDYVANSWARQETSADTGGLPFVFIQKSFILLLIATLFLQALAQVIKTLAVCRGLRSDFLEHPDDHQDEVL